MNTLILMMNISVIQYNAIADSDEYSVGQWHGIKVTHENVFFGYDKARVYPRGFGYNLEILSLGFRDQFQVTDKIRFFHEIGYAKIDDNVNGETTENLEGITYYLNGRFFDPIGERQIFKSYDVKTKDSIIGSIGIEFSYGNFFSTFGYRHFKMSEEIVGYIDSERTSPDGTKLRWEHKQNRNFSSIFMGFGWIF